MKTTNKKRVLLAVSGASGQIYAARMLQILKDLEKNADIRTEVVFSDTAKLVWEDELGEQVPGGALDNASYYHAFASGSNSADVMIIIPATMGTIGRIASGATSDLITRAADVMLKERRPLIIVPRETPLNLIHLENLTKLTLAGAIIAPASPSFYTHPQNLEELIDTFVRRIINIAGIKVDLPIFNGSART